MTSPDTTAASQPDAAIGDRSTEQPFRSKLRGRALDSAIRKRSIGVPTYSVPEAAALMSISQEYLYRLIQADAFPAVRMRLELGQGRYVVPAKAIEQLLDGAASAGTCVEAAALAEHWRATASGGA